VLLKTGYSDFTVILPTLNEEDTIGKMLDYVLENYKGARIIVADDGSRDGTLGVVETFEKKSKDVTLLNRASKGLVKGLTASVTDATKLSRTKFVIVIDADMQHPIDRIKDVAEKLVAGDELVVAVRAEITNWSLYRRAISRVFMYVGESVLWIEKKETCGDIFSGFFGVERELFVRVFDDNRKRFVGEGYKVLFDFLKCVDKGKLRIGEVPFTFKVRAFGFSKAGFRQGMALFKSFVR